MDDRYNAAWVEVEVAFNRLARTAGFGPVKRAAHLLADAAEELAGLAAQAERNEEGRRAQ